MSFWDSITDAGADVIEYVAGPAGGPPAVASSPWSPGIATPAATLLCKASFGGYYRCATRHDAQALANFRATTTYINIGLTGTNFEPFNPGTGEGYVITDQAEADAAEAARRGRGLSLGAGVGIGVGVFALGLLGYVAWDRGWLKG